MNNKYMEIPNSGHTAIIKPSGEVEFFFARKVTAKRFPINFYDQKSAVNFLESKLGWQEFDAVMV